VKLRATVDICGSGGMARGPQLFFEGYLDAREPLEIYAKKTKEIGE